MSEVTPKADEKKSKKERRYGNPPKIKEKGGTMKAEKDAAPKKEPGDAPVASDTVKDSTPGAAPNADVMSGTDGIPVQDRHMAEVKEMHSRQRGEMTDMHARHRDEHSKMAARHLKEMGGAE